MTRTVLIVAILAAASLAACATPNAPVVPSATMAPAELAAEQAAVAALVEGFGQALQGVSLQGADAAQQISRQYSPFVSPALLGTWMRNPAMAPGRTVSSPWPDHIEIENLMRDGPDRYTISGSLIEMTSLEVAKGGEAARIPVRLVAQKGSGGWLITQFAVGR